MDRITIEITENGTIKTTTDGVTQENHSNAEQFLLYIATLAGGSTTRTRRTTGHVHQTAKEDVKQ